MPVDFFDLPGEVRNKIYEELLIHSNTIFLNVARCNLDPPLYSAEFIHLCPAILQVNKKAHREASSILYSRNCFEVENFELFASFLDQIGPQNAGFLRRLVIAFPAFHNDGHSVGITLQDDGLRTLDLIRDKCQNIVTLETSLHTTTAMEICLDEAESPRAAEQALALVDARLKAIPSLQELLVHVYDEPINIPLREKMRDYGWIIKIAERDQWEIDGRSDDYDYDIDYHGYDSYDSYDAERLEREWWEDFERRNDSD
jgi:hypothetical protein